MTQASISIFVLLLIVSSCHTTIKDPYPNDKTISTREGAPFDSLTFYFPTKIIRDTQIVETEIDTFMLNWFSSALYSANEPILYNSYIEHDVYRLLLLTSLKPIIISLHKDKNNVWLTTKLLDKQPEFQELVHVNFETPLQIDSVSKPDRKASIVFNETKQLSENEWNEFERLLNDCEFWSAKPIDESRGIDGVEWTIEGHLKSKYWFVNRWSPEDKFRYAGNYLIEKSGFNSDNY